MSDPTTLIQDQVAAREGELIAFRRDLHAHPELGFTESRTTGRIVDALTAAGLSPTVFALGTGVRVDIGASLDGPMIAIRADIDALPIQETTGLPYASTIDGVCHACGHDVHTTIALGAALTLAALARQGQLPHPVRVIFQPAEEIQPGGAGKVIAEGVLEGVSEVHALHCDPRVEVGRIGLTPGPITSATDLISVRLTGPGGHTSRPHLTHDVVGAIGALVTQGPLVLSRVVDPRGGVSLVWGSVHAGAAPNAIPAEGHLGGTLRALDLDAWREAGDRLESVLSQIVAPYGVGFALDLVRAVPPVVNHPEITAVQEAAALIALGPDACEPTAQSLGGEDFGWMTQQVPGSMMRLGVRPPTATTSVDLHQGSFVVDEAAIAVGVRLMSQLAVMPR
ncbi:MAG TPA: amidohydrolase [Candidatus Avipropionibacterium avicola]|uniref:Amidohydrolase n=1 Tax=Candidatus Avipropionibacterium avicola TaxID=2840701 RepID=A0A9D1GY97_9ACTN|nr:amidohydrolase [Candidatus Avipropionibacterium avicola]